jgi:phosphopantetheinyl transferase
VSSELDARQALDVGGATLLVEPVEGAECPLGDRERVVLAGLRHPLRRSDWLAGRRVAKQVLLVRFGIPPDRSEVLPDAAGRPVVHAGGAPRPELRLSISHSGPWAAAACGRVGLGVDLCTLGDGARLRRIAPRVFSRGEAAAVGAFRSEERSAAAWAVKEACLKATGGGIFRPGTRSIRLLSAVPPRLEQTDLSARAWNLPGAVLALALEA